MSDYELRLTAPVLMRKGELDRACECGHPKRNHLYGDGLCLWASAVPMKSCRCRAFHQLESKSD